MKIEEWDTQQTLYQRVMFESMSYFEAVFELVKQGAAGEPQTYVLQPFKRGCPHGGVIDSSWDFPKVERFIRAMNHPPLPPARFEGVEITTIADYRKYVAGRKVDHEN
jgi:UDP-4-amino-4-deoxy-L-arabinose formyltransferase/UDP-glucuronic acid dehydrogenase (UDP-4-keto-hexauronic acid decarboxylating)